MRLRRICQQILPIGCANNHTLVHHDSQVRVFRLEAPGGGLLDLPPVLGSFWLFPCRGSAHVSGLDPDLCSRVKAMDEYVDISAATAIPAFPAGAAASLSCKVGEGFVGILIEWRHDAVTWQEHATSDRTVEGLLRGRPIHDRPKSGLEMGAVASEIMHEDSDVCIWDQWILPGDKEKGQPHLHHRDYWLVSLGYDGMFLEVPGVKVLTREAFCYRFGFSSQKATPVASGSLELASNNGKAPYRGILIEPKRQVPSYYAELLFHSFGEAAPEWIVENPQTGDPNQYINMEKSWTHVRMQDGRQLQVSFDFDGIELVSMPTKVADFYDNNAVESTYYSELDELLKRVTGCSGTRVFDTTRRTTSPSIMGGRQSRSPAEFVHGDQTPEAAPDRIRSALPEEADELLQKSRCCIVNVWRSIAGTIKQKPMAFMLQSKEARMAGFMKPVQRTSRHENRKSHMEFGVHSPDYPWITFPHMTMSEAVIFKTADSADPFGGVAHTAFTDPLSSPYDPPRQSIEARVLCFWE